MGKVVYKIGDDVSTDIIYPGRYMATVLPTETPQFAFADDKEFSLKLNGNEIPAGSFIVAGDNFGCGSSREQAASCLKGWETTIVARHIARIFLQTLPIWKTRRYALFPHIYGQDCQARRPISSLTSA